MTSCEYTPPVSFADSIVYGAIATGNRLFRFAARRTALREGAKSIYSCESSLGAFLTFRFRKLRRRTMTTTVMIPAQRISWGE